MGTSSTQYFISNTILQKKKKKKKESEYRSSKTSNTTVQKASILQCSVFFIVQLSHPYMTTEKTIALTITDLCWQSNVSAF